MRKLAFCLTVVSCLFMSANASAQIGPGCGCENGGGVSCGAGDGGWISPGCGANGSIGGGFGGQGAPVVSAGGGFGGPMVGPGCGANVGYGGGPVGPGCGTNGGLMGGGFMNGGNCGSGCGGNCGGGCGPGQGRRFGLGSALRGVGGRLRGRHAGACKYLTADIGWSEMESNAELVIGGVAQTVPQFEFDGDSVFRFGIGQYFGNWRLESEIGYRNYRFDDLQMGGNGPVGGQGNRETWTSMFNIYRDFYRSGRIQPYAKAGVGTSYNKSQATFSNFSPVIFAPLAINFPEDGGYELAWSVGGGLGIAINQRVMLDLEYQFMDLGATATGPNGMGTVFGMGDGLAHEFTMGFRINR